MKIFKKKDIAVIIGFVCFLVLVYCAFLPTYTLGAIRYQERVYKYLMGYIETNQRYPENEEKFLEFISGTNESGDIKKDFKIIYDIDIYSLTEKEGTIYDSVNKRLIFIEVQKFSYRYRLKDRAKTETYNTYKTAILPLTTGDESYKGF